MTEQATQIEQEINAPEVADEISYETMTDADLEQAVNGQPSEASEGEMAAQEPENGEEPAEPVKTVEELSAELEEAKKSADQYKLERDHWQKVRTEHEAEVGRYRKLKEELQRRLDANRQKDPAQMFIDDPQSMMDAAAERARLEMQLEQVGHNEQLAQQNAAIYQNQVAIDRFAPDLKDNIDGIAEMLKEFEPPERIQAFRQNYATYPAENILGVYNLYKERKARTELERQLKEYQERGVSQLQKIEKAARAKPMTNASSGASGNPDGGIDIENMSDSDLARLSDDDLNTLLGIK